MTQPDPSAVPPAARPTMRDVAALAGVSFKTVSRVINGVSTVDPGLVARVNTAADRLPTILNRALDHVRRGRSAVVSVRVPPA